MPSVFKLHLTRYIDASGKRVPASAPGARKVRERTRKWYGEYKDANEVIQRVALSSDKAAAQSLLNELVRKAERKASGLFDPFEEHAKRTVAEHITEYEAFMKAKNNSGHHVGQTIGRIRKLAGGCGFRNLNEIEAPKIANWLAKERSTKKRFSAQTSNFYLDAFKYFCNWLVAHDRMARNPLASLGRVSIEMDRRHDRRSITEDEFERLLRAAERGPQIQGLSGPDRAMLYLLATWTGFRRRELSSLTTRSLHLDANPPQVKVKAAYSKRRREDSVPLHPYVASRLTKWLAAAKPSPEEALFKLKTRKGYFRHTAIMMQRDLESARKQWVKEAKTAEQRADREASDFLKYKDDEGLFADFHSNRHTFISNLSRAGVSLTIAQKLARHSDPRLTANRYTHLEMNDQAAAIATLPTPQEPSVSAERPSVHCNQEQGETQSSGLVAGRVAVTSVLPLQQAAIADTTSTKAAPKEGVRKSFNSKTYGNDRKRQSLTGKVHPTGLEPVTFGSVVQN